MTRGDRGIRIEVRLVHAWLALMWAAAVGLLVWMTAGGPIEAGEWGIFVTGVAATASICYATTCSTAMLRSAYELGRDARDEIRAV